MKKERKIKKSEEFTYKTPEKEIVRQAKDGSIAAFEKILFIYEKRIFNYLYRMLGNRFGANAPDP